MEEIKFLEINGRKIAAVIHKADSKNLVIMCHGYRGSKMGPNRLFVNVARKLAEKGINTLRFDQFGSGDSEGDFMDSRFNDWVEVTRTIAEKHLKEGHRVSLLGQSMGGATVIVAASKLGSKLNSVVAWVPDPEIGELNIKGEYAEEAGLRVSWEYWKQAHDADVINHLKSVRIPGLIFQAENDEYIDENNKKAIRENAPENIRVEFLKGHGHSSWTFDQGEKVVNETVQFLTSEF